MAQPTIYANIDCDGQVEVKVNNDTGYPCTIITNTGVNESIPSTGTDVYRNYNLTSSDWVKVVAAQDVTIAANKLNGTIKYITSVTTTPTPTTTSTTTTPAGGGSLPLAAGSCSDGGIQNWPSYGATAYYTITFPAINTEQWWNIDISGGVRKVYMDDGSGGLIPGPMNIYQDASDSANGDPVKCFTINTVPNRSSTVMFNGFSLTAAFSFDGSGYAGFGLSTSSALNVGVSLRIWIV